MPRCPVARPVGTYRPTPAKAARPSDRTADVLFGVIPLGGWTNCVMPVPECYRRAIGTSKTTAYYRYAPGCYDWHLARMKAERVEYWVRLWVDHKESSKLCSTLSGALTVKATDSALLFMVTADTRDGRETIRAARKLPFHRQASSGTFLLRGEWSEGEPDEPGYLTITRGVLQELSLVKAGAVPGTSVLVDDFGRLE